jgi:hypothetical protein
MYIMNQIQSFKFLLIFFLIKIQTSFAQASTSTLDPRVGALITEVGEININGTNKLKGISNTLNTKLEKIDLELSLIMKSLSDKNSEGALKVLNEINYSSKEIKTLLKDIKASNEQKIKDEKAPEFLVEDVISLYNDYKNQIKIIKDLINNITEGKKEDDPIFLNLRSEINLINHYDEESKKGKFWDMIEKKIIELKNRQITTKIGNIEKIEIKKFSFLIISDLQKILLRKIESMDYKTIRSKLLNFNPFIK